MNYKEFYCTSAGRVTRTQFWRWLIAPIVVIGFAMGILDGLLGTWNAKAGAGLFSGLFSLAILVPSVMVQVKRFHDRDKTGWWTAVGAFPIIGAIWLLLELGFLRGTPGPNRFGPEPGNEANWVFRAKVG